MLSLLPPQTMKADDLTEITVSIGHIQFAIGPENVAPKLPQFDISGKRRAIENFAQLPSVG
jgi:hypothetical protein